MKIKPLRHTILMIMLAFLGAHFFAMVAYPASFALNHMSNKAVIINRIELLIQQIKLLKERVSQAKSELIDLQSNVKINQDAYNKENLSDEALKTITDKAFIDISISESRIDNINLELTESQQAIAVITKNIQTVENQINLLNVFNLNTVNSDEPSSVQSLNTNLAYESKLLELEKSRANYLFMLQKIAISALRLKKEKYHYLANLIKFQKIFNIQQQQIKGELNYQEQQNYWLKVLNHLYTDFNKVGLSASQYQRLEQKIFYANENANFSYIQSLAERYQSQLRQMQLMVLKNHSILLLSDVNTQVQTLNKQMIRLEEVLKARILAIDKYQALLKEKYQYLSEAYNQKLSNLKARYALSDKVLLEANHILSDFRVTLDKALQRELSSRQRFLIFNMQAWLHLGEEILSIPAITFQVLKSFSSFFMQILQTATIWTFLILLLFELCVVFLFCFFRRFLLSSIRALAQLQTEDNFKWVGLRWLQRNFLDIVFVANLMGIIFFLGMHMSHVKFFAYLTLIWLTSKGIISLARLCLVETTHDDTGQDVRLYFQLKWIIMVGSVITIITVFVYQLPMLYQLQMLFSRLFLFFLLIVSLLLLRFWEVVPNFILSHVVSKHPYFPKTIRLLGILIPSLLLANSIAGLLGFVNLIYIFSWYEGIFLIVLSTYLILRGLLSDGMEQLSRLMIQYVNNGWLWTEAFLKPLDKILRITLFFVAWAVLFILYGWDKQSPIVERLTRLLHYQLISALNILITPMNIIELIVVVSIFYWIARWTREFVYRILASRTKDMGIRNSIAILSQYSVVGIAVFISLRVLGIDLRALTVLIGMFSLGIGLGLRDLANNFACGFLILLERPLRVGDLVEINGLQGEVTHLGSRAVTVRTGDRLELVVPNADIFHKTFINWTARDNIIRMVLPIKIGRHDNPHEVKLIIYNVLAANKDILEDPPPDAFLKEINDSFLAFELRFFVNIRQIQSQVSVTSRLLMDVWDAFAKYNIKPPYPMHVVCLEDNSQVKVLTKPNDH